MNSTPHEKKITIKKINFQKNLPPTDEDILLTPTPHDVERGQKYL